MGTIKRLPYVIATVFVCVSFWFLYRSELFRAHVRVSSIGLSTSRDIGTNRTVRLEHVIGTHDGVSSTYPPTSRDFQTNRTVRQERVFHDGVSSTDLPTLSSLNSQPCKDHEERTLKYRYLDVKLVCKTINEPCYNWYWDVANWTLTYTSKQMSTNTSNPTRFCPIPIHGERTAKIIQADGKVEYPGCTIEKDLCAPRMSLFYAYFDKDLKMRINRSPCCRKLLVDITHHMGRVFNKHNITYFLVGGTVISLVRDNGELIPYDTDTDVAADASDLEKVKAVIPELEKPGYIFRWKTEYEKAGPIKRYMVGCTNKQRCLTGPGIAFYVIEDGMVVSIPQWQSVPANLTVPPIKGMFEGLEMGFPKEPEKYLDHTYGKDKWRTPLQCTKHYYGQCS